MKKFIRVTNEAGREMVIFTECLSTITAREEGGSSITVIGGYYPWVKESPEEIINLMRNAES
jgi:hypothetical protein